MSSAIRIHETGGPEVLKWEEVTVGDPGAGEVRLRHGAVGLNFIDVYFRTGVYGADVPFTPGLEASGVVRSPRRGCLGPAGGRSCCLRGTAGRRLFRGTPDACRSGGEVPEGVSDEIAAAMMLKGMTAQYLLRQTYPVKAGDTILFHAAAGGVGLIACQWAKHLGATVIGTVGSDEKAELAAAHGCDHPIVYTRENLVERVKSITGGEGVPVVYDSVGKDTFMHSLDCLRPLGTMVIFGQSSGPVPPLEVGLLAAKGSLFPHPADAHDLYGQARGPGCQRRTNCSRW